MPYVRQQVRDEFASAVRAARGALSYVGHTQGNPNYLLTKIVLEYLAFKAEGPAYSDFAEAVAALECAKLELYRRAVAPYEDYKKRMNGDVYGTLDTNALGKVE